MSTPDSTRNDWTAYFRGRAGRMLAELEELVRIETPSKEAAAIRRFAERLAASFAETGARVEIVDEHPNGPNLVVRFGEGERPVLLLGHMDTVWPLGTLERMPWRTDRERAYGPGVFDMKAGCLVALESLRAMATHGMTPPVSVLLTCDEEVGSASSATLVEREALAARAVLVLEPCIPGGLAKTSRSGIAFYRVRVQGRAAHAGVDPEKGLSAIGEAARLVAELHQMADLDAGLSVNVGVIRGGTRANVVAAEATLEVDVRFRSLSDGERIDAAIRALATDRLPAVEVDGGISRAPLEPTEATMALYEAAARAARASGFEMGHGHVGGVSDGNLTAALGVPTLDGLGVDGMGAHADHEQILVADLPGRPAMLTRLIEDLTA